MSTRTFPSLTGVAPSATAAVALCGMVAGAATAQPGADVAAGPTLTVAGRGEVAADPDTAVVRMGVAAEDAEAAAAQNQVNETLQKVLDAVTQLGIPARAVQTQELSLAPIYSNYRPRPGQDEPEPPRITGYQASSVVSIELDDLSQVGAVVDAGITAGANQLQGVAFRLEDAAAARAEALTEAVQDARARAEAIALAMNMQIEGVRDVIAGEAQLRPPMPLQGARFDVAELAATPVQPGQVELSATVTITYAIRDRAGEQ